MRHAELFAGAGGMALGFHRSGMETAWLAELAEFPSRVLRARFPDVPLYGDVTTLDGAALVAAHGPIDLLAGGSPCQDLSVAGKRQGLAGARSGLFHHQMRLWSETGADLCLWENVAGALSSNNGKDFAAVLSAFVGGTIAVPRDGWTGERVCGVVSGPSGVAAWRLLDAQYFGVPQRRLRIFVLGARAGRIDPAEVLLEPEGVFRDSPTRREAGEGIAADAQGGAGKPFAWNEEVITSPVHRGGVTPDAASQGRTRGGRMSIAFNQNQDGGDGCEALFSTLRTNNHPAVVCLTGDVTHALTHEGHDASEDGTGRGTPIVVGALTPGAHPGGFNGQDAYTGHIVVGTLPSVHRGVPSSDSVAQGLIPVTAGIPRRLMPVECERLMSWGDGWTDVPDEKGKPASDSVRYKACGNGVVSNVAEWIGLRILGGAA